jgi:4a-hydroxytetrahydrobiopterin dehydratase
MWLKIVSLTAALQHAAADYSKVIGETCPQLQDSTSFFETFLFPCAQYTTDQETLYCLQDADPNVLQTFLNTVPEWTLVPDAVLGDSLTRTFVFADFQTAFYFMTQSAQLAEKNQHHPLWTNLWNTVEVKLTTDDKACISTFDFELAQGMDLIASKILLKSYFLQ